MMILFNILAEWWYIPDGVIICNIALLYFDFRAPVALGSLDDIDPLNMIHIFYN